MRKKSDRQREKRFIVTGRQAMPAIKHWMRDRGAKTYSYGGTDAINVGTGAGRSYQFLGRIVITDPAWFEETLKHVRKALGLPDESAA